MKETILPFVHPLGISQSVSPQILRISLSSKSNQFLEGHLEIGIGQK